MTTQWLGTCANGCAASPGLLVPTNPNSNPVVQLIALDLVGRPRKIGKVSTR